MTSPSRSTVHLLDAERLGEHLPRLMAVALGLTRSRHDAEDVVQETLTAVLRRPRVIHGDVDGAYLVQCLRGRRRRRVRVLLPRGGPTASGCARAP